MDPLRSRRLTIGEYAAATQLTPKALRLYDEQLIIKPGVVDPSTGYRFYHSDQVPVGRFVRTLRDMNLSLVQIRQLLECSQGIQIGLLRDYLRDAELRFARERAAYQSALLMLHQHSASETAPIEEVDAVAERVAATTFWTTRQRFLDDALQQLASRSEPGEKCSTATFTLLEPLADEDTRVELTVSANNSDNSGGAAIRHLPARRYARIALSAGDFADGIAASTDALFDWFDRRGFEALGSPEVVLTTAGDLGSSVRWAFVAG